MGNAVVTARLLPTLQKWKETFLAGGYDVYKEQKVLISFGSWDAMFRNVKYFARYTMSALVKFFETIRDDSLFSRVKFYVLTVPAVPDTPRRLSNKVIDNKIRDLRNNALLAAIAGLIIYALKEFQNVVVLDYFAITVSRNNEALDATHFLRPEVNNDTVDMHGPIGIAAVKLLLENMCLK